MKVPSCDNLKEIPIDNEIVQKKNEEPEEEIKQLKEEPKKENKPIIKNQISENATLNNNDSGKKVILKPLGETTKKKLFGLPLDEVMEAQKEQYPKLTVPYFFSEAGQLVRKEGLYHTITWEEFLLIILYY